MPSAGLLEQARRGRYRAAPPVVPVPTEAERQQAQLTLAQLDPADFVYSEDLPALPPAMDRRSPAARAEAQAAAAQPAGSPERAPAPAATVSTGPAATAPAGRPVPLPRPVQSAAPPAAPAVQAATSTAPAPTRFAGFRIPGTEGLVAPGRGDERAAAASRSSPNLPQPTAAAQPAQAAPAAPAAAPQTQESPRRPSEGTNLVADRHAAGVLTRLVSAVVEGGKGRAPRSSDQTKSALAALITEAHRVSSELTAAAAGDTPVRRSLQATMLKETAFALARHYNNTGEVASDTFRQVARDMLDAGAALVPQDALDLLGQTVPDYGNFESELQYAEDRLRAAAFEIAWDVQRAVEDPRLHMGQFFDLAEGTPEAEQPFTYGQPVNQVRSRLLQAARRIVDGARPDIHSPAMLARWEEGALGRAAKLLCVTYRTETASLLRTEATSDLLGRARTNALGRTFESMVASAERKAGAQFNEIERSAPELMRLGERAPVEELPREVPRAVERERS
ncbi:hypothetical protein [Achromobacter sp. DH1f]|uniref:hypothetical protein n=1 Tax=Achromobacter sp. DH1f TaxID=1397275 RepID=UPI000469AD93|nr:hypothetical protein [Achromobacter sp. DH1f]